MSKGNATDRIERLETLTLHLKQDGYCTVDGLASKLGVSRRTLTRDIEILRKQGLPIDAERGRGGGIQLDSNWGVGRVNFSHAEAVDLLVSLAVAEQMNSPIFLANLNSIRRQLMSSFAPDKRHKVKDLKSRILIGQSASKFVLESFESVNRSVVQKLHQAFLDKRAMTVRYTSEGGGTTRRDVEPHYLLLHYPVWYVLAWDKLQDAPRTFRCDRISRAFGTEDRFKLLPKDTFNEALEGSYLL